MYEENKTAKLLKNISKFCIIEFVLISILAIVGIIKVELGIIHDLGRGILVGFSGLASLCLIPELISGICGLRYCLGKNKGKLTACWIWGIISLFVNFRFIYIMNEEVDFGDIIPICLFLIFNLPNILYLIGCYKAQFKNKV